MTPLVRVNIVREIMVKCVFAVSSVRVVILRKASVGNAMTYEFVLDFTGLFLVENSRIDVTRKQVSK